MAYAVASGVDPLGRRAFLASLSASCLSPWLKAAQQANAPSADISLSVAEVEEFLKTAEVTDTHGTKVGVTASIRATLADSRVTHFAHVQTIDESKAMHQTAMGTELNFRDTWKFNIAGYRLDRMLGLNMTPPSVERKFRGQQASFTWWMGSAMMEAERLKKKRTPPDVDGFNHQMYIVRVFDQLIFNTDRNLQYLLITPDWKIWMIDHTRAFRRHKDLKNAKNLGQCERTLLTKLRSLTAAALETSLGDYLIDSEWGALLARRDKIVQAFEKKIAAKGEGQVLYDLAPRDPLYRAGSKNPSV